MPASDASAGPTVGAALSRGRLYPLLHTCRGELMLVSVAVAPRHLEALLDALNTLNFPVNPEVYHGATLTRRYPDGREESSLTYLVEFAAYASDLEAVKTAVDRLDFLPQQVVVSSFLEGASSLLLLGPESPDGVRSVIRKPSSPLAG